MSSHDIPKGERWLAALGKELEQSRFGLICLTPESLASDWISFEAGAISKHLDRAFVAPLLLGLSPDDVDGPLAQFQLTSFNQTEVRQLVSSIVAQMSPTTGPVLWEVPFTSHWRALARAIDPIIAEIKVDDDRGDDDNDGDDTELFIEDDAILTVLAEMRGSRLENWIDVDTVKKKLGLSTRVAEYHLEKLERLGLVDGAADDDGWWCLSQDGLRYVVDEGLVD